MMGYLMSCTLREKGNTWDALSPFLPFDSLRDTLLYQAAIGVSSSYDALLELFECVAHFLKRLHIYTEKIPPSSTM